MKFNPSRLSIARQRRKLNKKELSESLGVDLRTIVRWEKCQSEPTLENLESIASTLNFPKGFFFGPDVDEPITEHTSFRSQTSMSAAERDAALAAGRIGFLISDWIEERFELPEVRCPDLHLSLPESGADMLRQEWGLGLKPISSMVQLLESKGVRVFSLSENTIHVNAFSLWRKGVPFVFLNTYKSAECSRFDAAHELAHLVLHQDGGVTGRAAEEQANQFASAFLMPKSDVIGHLPRVRNLNHLIEAKSRWRVSLAALNYRLHKLGITNDWTNRTFCIEIVKKGYNKQEPFETEREKSVAWEKVLKALWSENTTQADIASDLNLPPNEVSDLLFDMLRVSPPDDIKGHSLTVLGEIDEPMRPRESQSA